MPTTPQRVYILLGAVPAAPRMVIPPARVTDTATNDNASDHNSDNTWDTPSQGLIGRLPSMADKAHWLSADAVLREQRTDRSNGLSDAEAAARLRQCVCLRVLTSHAITCVPEAGRTPSTKRKELAPSAFSSARWVCQLSVYSFPDID